VFVPALSHPSLLRPLTIMLCQLAVGLPTKILNQSTMH
jgi:hypothetical protein